MFNRSIFENRLIKAKAQLALTEELMDKNPEKSRRELLDLLLKGYKITSNYESDDYVGGAAVNESLMALIEKVKKLDFKKTFGRR